MEAKTSATHLGLPPSLNVIGSRGGHHTYNALKVAWEEILRAELNITGLPAGWGPEAAAGTPKIRSIHAEGVCCFPRANAKDQGNFRWFLEKVVGDTLEAGGWIKDDSFWPVVRFEFGGLQFEHRLGEFWTRVMLFATY